MSDFYVAHAALAENGTVYGEPGDQTGREVRLDNLGQDGNTWVKIYTPKNNTTGDRIGKAAEAAALNELIGYSQKMDYDYSGRYGFYNALQKFGSPQEIKVACNCDCSSFVSALLISCGIKISPYMTTRNLDQLIRDTNLFTVAPYDADKIKPGCIVWREGHTGIICTHEETVYIPSASVKYVGKITKQGTKIYIDLVGKNVHPRYAELGKNNLVDVCDEKDGMCYVHIWEPSGINSAGTAFYGFVKRGCLKKV